MPLRQVTLRILGDSRSARAELDWVNMKADELNRRRPTLHIGAETPTAKLEAIRLFLDNLAKQRHSIQIDANDRPSLLALSRIDEALIRLNKRYDTLNQRGDRISTLGLQKFETALRQTDNDFGRLIDSAKRFGAANTEAEKSFSVLSSSGMGLWNTRIKLFGSASHGASLLAVALHVGLEVIIATTEALIALAPALAGLAGSAQDIGTHFRALQTVSDTLTHKVGPLTGGLHNLQVSLAPQGVQLFGAAMLGAARNTGVMTQAAHTVSGMFVNGAAKIDLWAQKQRSANELMQHGIGFIHQFGVFFGQFLLTLDNLIKVDPGVTHVLFDVGNGIMHLIQGFTRLPAPIVKSVIAIHAIYFWGGLASTMLIKLASYVGRLTGATKAAEALGLLNRRLGTLAGLSANQWTGLIALAAVIGIAWAKSSGATPEIQKFINTINQRIDTERASVAIIDISNAIGQLQREIKSFTVSDAMASFGKIGNLGSDWLTAQGFNIRARLAGIGVVINDVGKIARDAVHGAIPNIIGLFGDLGKVARNAIDPAAGVNLAYAQSMDKLRAAEQKLIGQFGNLAREAGDLARGQAKSVTTTSNLTGKLGMLSRTTHAAYTGGMSFAQALTVMDLAGIRANDGLDLMREKVKLLLTGFKDMGVQQGILLNATNAATFGYEFQQNKVNDLIQGYQQFLAVVTGGENAFVTFAQDMKSVSNSMNQAGGTVRTVIKTFAPAATATGSVASASGRLASAQARVASAQATVTSEQGILTREQRAGNTAASILAATHQRLHAAQLRVTAAQQALSQAQAGGTGAASGLASAAGTANASFTGLNASSLQLRSTWNAALTQAGTMLQALLAQSAAAGLGTRGYHLLTQAGKDLVSQLLAGARGSKANTAQLYALAQVAGYGGKDSFKALSHWVGNTHDAMGNLDKITTIFTRHSADLAADVKNLAEAINKNLNQQMAQAIFLATGGTEWLNKFAESILHSHGNIKDMIPSAQKLADQLIKNTGNAQEAHKMFDTFAVTMHLTKAKADDLWDSLHKLGQQHENPTVNVHAAGSGAVKAYEQGLVSKAKGMEIRFASTGYRIPGYGGGDKHLILAEAGETIVPKHLTPVIAPLMRQEKVPGFASGGMIGGAGSVGQALPFVHTKTADFVKQASAEFMKEAIREFRAATSGGASIVADAMRWIGKIPYVWGGTAVPGGADCSGFTSTIYSRHGITGVPRTSEAQGAWVRKGPPIPGGLAFYHSPAGGPDPGHVAIVRDGRQVISQGGGMGPKLETLHFLPLLWTGIPPHGFGGPAGFGGSLRENQLASLWIQAGGSRGLAHLMSAIAMAESGGRASAHNPSGASGLWQVMPGSQMVRGNLFNPLINAENAVAIERVQGLRAWSAYTNGAYRRFYSRGTEGAAPGWAWVGENGPELVKFHGGERVLDTITSAMAGFTGPGYARGTSEEHRRGLSLYREFRQDAKTAAQVARDSRHFLQVISAFYTGSARRTRDTEVRRQTRAMEDAARRLKSIQDDNKAAVAYKKTVYGNLSGYGALSGLDLGATPGVGDNVALSGGQGLTIQLQAKLATLRQFAAALKKLHAHHLPNSLFRQIVDMGPDQGLQYANEILSGGGAFMTKLAGLEKEITGEERGISRGAGSVIAGRGFVTSEKAFWNGIKNSQRDLERLFTHLGKVLGREATKWFHVPPAPRHRRRGQLGGILREHVEGLGLSSGTHYSFGEAGEEMFAPLPSPHPGFRPSGGDTFIISVAGDTDPDGAAYRIIQKIKDYKRHHGNQPLNL